MASLIETRKVDGRVFALAVSPDGARLGAAVGSSVMIWDLHSGQVALGPLKGHTEPAFSVAFSPDGRTIASASYDETIRIWDTETGNTALGPLTGHTRYVYSVTFSPDGRLLISGSWDKTICLWDALTGQPVREQIRTGSWVYSVAISPDGARVYSALNDNTIRAYDTDTGALLLTFAGHESPVYSVAVSPDGRRIASGSDDKTVRIWDAATGQAIGDPLKGHTDHVVSVVFSPDGKYIASGSRDQTIRIWDAETGAMLNGPLRGHSENLWAVVFARDGTLLISGSDDRTIKVWDVHNLKIQPRLQNNMATPQTQSTAIEHEITATTTLAEIVAHLGTRGCANLTYQLDMTTCGTFPISSGGFGDIFRGELKDGTKVAIKTIRLYASSDEQTQKHLKYAARELYTWSRCKHRNVQPLLGLVMFRDQIGMIATWESNGSLPQYLMRNVDTDRCVLSTQVAEGLLYLHSSGMIHGDLKGANVLVSKDGVAQLADFGNATLQDYSLQFSKTSTKESLSPRWAAPELFKGGKCTAQADVYALGMTILETITGQIPWIGKNDHTVMYAVVFEKTHPERSQDHIPTQSSHGDVLWDLLMSCWEFESGKRPSALEVHKIMEGITQDGLKD